MEAVKNKWLWGIFISLLCIFAMSHNASALTINFDNYEPVRSASAPNIDCRNSSHTQTFTNQALCRFESSADRIGLEYIYTNYTFPNLKAGDIVEYYITASTVLNYGIDGGTFGLMSYVPSNSNISTLNVETVELSDALILDYYSSSMPDYPSYDYMVGIYNKNRVFRTYKITQRIDLDGNYKIGLARIGCGNICLFNWYQNVNNTTIFYMHDLFIYRRAESKENKEVEEKTQEAVDESQAAGGDSSTSAQSGTTGLLNAITGAVSVISSATPTNCKINGNMGNLDMGQLDLCANPAPAFVQTIGSLILILMCVPLAISLFNRFIAIFRSFQN